MFPLSCSSCSLNGQLFIRVRDILLSAPDRPACSFSPHEATDLLPSVSTPACSFIVPPLHKAPRFTSPPPRSPVPPNAPPPPLCSGRRRLPFESDAEASERGRPQSAGGAPFHPARASPGGGGRGGQGRFDHLELAAGGAAGSRRGRRRGRRQWRRRWRRRVAPGLEGRRIRPRRLRGWRWRRRHRQGLRFWLRFWLRSSPACGALLLFLLLPLFFVVSGFQQRGSRPPAAPLGRRRQGPRVSR